MKKAEKKTKKLIWQLVEKKMEKLKIEKKNQSSIKKQITKEENPAELKDSTYLYGYSLKKPKKKLSEDYGVEQVITPVKSSSRKQSLHSNLISKKKHSFNYYPLKF